VFNTVVIDIVLQGFKRRSHCN